MAKKDRGNLKRNKPISTKFNFYISHFDVNYQMKIIRFGLNRLNK